MRILTSIWLLFGKMFKKKDYRVKIPCWNANCTTGANLTFKGGWYTCSCLNCKSGCGSSEGVKVFERWYLYSEVNLVIVLEEKTIYRFWK
jgi:hypothetical protein